MTSETPATRMPRLSTTRLKSQPRSRRMARSTAMRRMLADSPGLFLPTCCRNCTVLARESLRMG